MTDESEMTAAEWARVEADILAQRLVRMRRLSDGRIVQVGPDRVAERLASGQYELVEPTET